MPSDRDPILVRVVGWPRPQPRPKAYVRGQHASVYDPGTAAEWRARVELAMEPHRPAVPLLGPVRIDLIFVIPRPKGHFGSGRNKDKLKPSSPRYWHTAKAGKHGGDRDNYAKAVADALTDAGVLDDDALICWGETRKRWARPGPPKEQGGALIRIMELEDQEPLGTLSETDRRLAYCGPAPPPLVKPKRPKAAKEKGNPWRPFTDHFVMRWRAVHGANYTFQGAKDAQNAQRIWEAVDGDLDTAKGLVDVYLADDGWAASCGHTLGVLWSKINEYRAKLAPAKPAGRTREELKRAIAARCFGGGS